MSRLSNNTDFTANSDLVKAIGGTLSAQGSQLVPNQLTQAVISMEGFADESVRNNVQMSAATLRNTIKQCFDTVGKTRGLNYQLSEQQLEAASIVAAARPRAKDFALASRSGQISLEGIDMPSSGTAFGSLNFRAPSEALVSMEAFDNSELQKGIDVSVVFNALAVGQSPFNEEWFPPVVGTPDEIVFRINVPRILVQNEYIPPNQSGDPADFKKKNLIRAALDYTILMNNSTEIVPIYRTGVNTDKFVNLALIGGQPLKAVVGAVEVDTAPLKPGVKVSLLNLASNEALKLAGVVSETDAVEPKVSLKNLYVLVTDSSSSAGASSVIKFKVKDYPRAGFFKPMQGNIREMDLAFRSDVLTIKPDTKDIAGAAPTALAALISAGYTLRLDASLNGDLNMETSNLTTQAGAVTAASLLDEDGKVLSLDSTEATAILDNLTFAVLGYDLDARRTNSNLRTKGLILNPDMEQRPYYVPLNAPLVSQTPIGQEQLGLDLNALVQGVHIQIENNAVTTLLSYAESLNDRFISSEVIDLYPSFEAVGELLVAPYYKEITVDMVLALNSVSSANRVNDIQGVLNAVIRQEMAHVLRETGYTVALRANNGGAIENPHVIAVTDLLLERYLMTNGDDRYLGTNATFSVTAVSDLRMRDTIFLSFGRKATGKHDPLTFGNMLYIPELSVSAQVNRNGATISERQVQPRFRHVVNLPILVKINVTRLAEASQDAAIIYNKPQA